MVSGGGGGVVQPKLSVSIHKRRKRRRQQLNRIRSEFLLDSSSVRMPLNGNLTLMTNHQFSGISPTLSSSSASSSASTSSLESLATSGLSSSCAQVLAELPSFRTATGQSQAQLQPHNHHNQWYSGCYASGLNINNNYLIPTPVYDVPNEVIDDGASPQQQQPGFGMEYESQEVTLYGGNNNPLSSWEEFILTTNKSGPGERLFNTAQLTRVTHFIYPFSPLERGDILICGNCRELFHDLEQLLQHRKTTCQLRVFCECRNTAAHPPSPTLNGKSSSDSVLCLYPDDFLLVNTYPRIIPSKYLLSELLAENTILFCRMCRKQFSHPLALLQHVQHVHQIKIFETEHDYTPDKDLVTTPHGDSPISEAPVGSAAATAAGIVPVE